MDLEKGLVRNVTTGQVYQAEPYPPFMVESIEAGGPLPCTRQHLSAARGEV